MTIAGLARYGITGVGICLEKAPGRRTGTAGWYRTAATASLASSLGSEFTFLNAYAFSDEAKDQAAAILTGRYGPVDYLVYSVAAPRRTDPDTGVTHVSVLKPLGQAATMRTLGFSAGAGPRPRHTRQQFASAGLYTSLHNFYGTDGDGICGVWYRAGLDVLERGITVPAYCQRARHDQGKAVGHARPHS